MPAKVVSAVFCIFSLSLLAIPAVLIGAVVIVVLGYLTYSIIRSIAVAHTQQGETNPRPEKTPGPAAVPVAAADAGAVDLRSEAARQLAAAKRSPAQPILLLSKTPRERAAELAGSLLLSAAVSAAMSLVLLLLRGEPPRPEQYAWLALMSTIGAWSILSVAKLWERSSGEAALRRFTMLLLGLGLGVVAYLLNQALWIELPYGVTPGSLRIRMFAPGFYDARGNPLLHAYMAYFGSLFLIVRWWLQAYPLRSARLSLWSLICTVVTAGLLNLAWPLPQDWGVMVAVTLSIAVQLASPWLPPHERVRRRIA
jgi:hypothetical protein